MIVNLTLFKVRVSLPHPYDMVRLSVNCYDYTVVGQFILGFDSLRWISVEIAVYIYICI